VDNEDPRFPCGYAHLMNRQGFPRIGHLEAVKIDVGLDGKIPLMQAAGDFRMNMIHRSFDVFRRVGDLESHSMLHQVFQL